MTSLFVEYLGIPEADLRAIELIAWRYYANKQDLDVSIDVLLRRMTILQIGPRLANWTFAEGHIWDIISLINNVFSGVSSDEEKAKLAADLGGVDAARLVLALAGTTKEQFEQAIRYTGR